MTLMACHFPVSINHGRLNALVDKMIFMIKQIEMDTLENMQLLLHEAIELLDAVQSLPVIEY